MLKQRRAGTAALALALVSIVGVASPARAADSSNYSQLKSFWTAHDVSSATQVRLLAKLARGDKPDSFKNVAPLTVETSVANYQQVSEATFADGSVSTTSVQLPMPKTASSKRMGTLAAGKIAGCSTDGTSGHITFTDCNVQGSNGAVQMGFFATFTYVQGGPDYINNKGNSSWQSCFPGGCSTPTFSSWKQYETSSSKAYLTYKTLWNKSGTSFLTLSAGGQAASATITAP